MANTHRFTALAIALLCSSPAFAASTPAPAAAPSSPQIQFGIPANETLADARKKAHEKTATLDKMTPEQWDAGQKDFHAQMERLSKLPPDEQQRLFPGVPPEILSHMGHAGITPAGQPKLTPAESLARAQKNAHARADKLDKMTDQEWAERVKRNGDAIEKYKAMKDDQDKHALIGKLLKQQAPADAGAPATLGQSKIPAGKSSGAPQ
jgi:hypothetical protein